MVSLLGKRTKQETGVPEPPPDWMGSKPEYVVFWALMKLGMKGKFVYQSPQMGGRLVRGGAVIDFYFPDLKLAINVQSLYYHYATTIKRIAGQLQRAQLESIGIKVIFIDEADALRNPVYFVSEALSGRDHSRFGG